MESLEFWIMFFCNIYNYIFRDFFSLCFTFLLETEAIRMSPRVWWRCLVSFPGIGAIWLPTGKCQGKLHFHAVCRGRGKGSHRTTRVNSFEKKIMYYPRCWLHLFIFPGPYHLGVVIYRLYSNVALVVAVLLTICVVVYQQSAVNRRNGEGNIFNWRVPI